ncbi:hypothetical protein HAX54_023809 [Datura stramonium]|uniref:Uncharacterized protein n=1 Tax=Datura stramonium TaxID=4076 RepID=A0ABS8UZC8_DATST|nr:hypothetical protein [Datura stramonium]
MVHLVREDGEREGVKISSKGRGRGEGDGKGCFLPSARQVEEKEERGTCGAGRKERRAELQPLPEVMVVFCDGEGEMVRERGSVACFVADGGYAVKEREGEGSEEGERARDAVEHWK